MTKSTIQLPNGTLVTVEGTPEEVARVLDLYKDGNTPATPKVAGTKKGAEKARRSNHKSKRGKETYKIPADLNLNPSGKKTFRAFFEEKNPGSNMELNAVAVYHLEKVLGAKNIGPEHIYSYYKMVGRKVPAALMQSLYDTASLKSWIDTGETNNIHTTIVGENFVEHDLPAKKAPAKA